MRSPRTNKGARALLTPRDSGTTVAHRLARLVPAYLRDLPPSVPSTEAKVYYTRLAGPICGALLHLILVGAYLVLAAPRLALVNTLSVAIFVVAAYVVRRGNHLLGVTISVVECAVHLPIATWILGLDAGYLYYNFILAMAAALAYTNREWLARIVVVGYAGLSSAVCTIVLRGATPVVELAPWKLEIVSWFNASGTFFALVLFAYYFVTVADRAERRVAVELERSDQLLLNVLPAQVAERLKSQPGTISDAFPCATVLFADIVGFTNLAATRPASVVVEMLNELFSTYDRIAERYGLEKIKTIGDAYMVAAGVPDPRPDHAAAVVAMALEMIDATSKSRLGGRRSDDERLDVRIGVHSGPVVAGVIGERKFAYDLWGDTVNLASRLESHGVPGRVQISEATRELLGDAFDIEERGVVELKGRGPTRVWLVRGRNAAALSLASLERRGAA